MRKFKPHKKRNWKKNSINNSSAPERTNERASVNNYFEANPCYSSDSYSSSDGYDEFVNTLSHSLEDLDYFTDPSIRRYHARLVEESHPPIVFRERKPTLHDYMEDVSDKCNLSVSQATLAYQKARPVLQEYVNAHAQLETPLHNDPDIDLSQLVKETNIRSIHIGREIPSPPFEMDLFLNKDGSLMVSHYDTSDDEATFLTVPVTPNPLTTNRVQEIAFKLKEKYAYEKKTRYESQATPQMNFIANSLSSSLFGDGPLKELLSSSKELKGLIEEKLPDVGNYDELLKLVNTASGTVNGSSTKNFSKSLWKAGMILAGAIALGSFIHYQMTNDSLTIGIGCTAIAICGYAYVKIGMPQSGIVNIVTFCCTYFQNRSSEGFAVAQGNLDSCMDTVAVFAATIFGVNSDSPTISKLTTHIKDYARSRQSLHDIVKNLISVFQSCYNTVCCSIPGMKTIRLLGTEEKRVDSWIKEVDEVFDQYNCGDLLRTSVNMVVLDDLVKLGESLISDFRREKFGMSIVSQIRVEMKKLKELRSTFLSFRVTGDGSRPEPSCALFRGGPGVFKSVLLERISDLLVKDSLKDAASIAAYQEDKLAFIYPRAHETKFFDGYKPTTVVMCQDDFGQSTDAQGVPDNEYFNTIRANCGFPFLLHCADIESKGNLYFKAKYSLATTNRKEFSSLQSIRSTAAFLRRWHVDTVVTIKQKYCSEQTVSMDIWNRECDSAKLMINEFGETSIPSDVWEFHVVRESGGSLETLEILDYSQICQRLIANKVRKEREYYSNQRTMQDENDVSMMQLYGCYDLSMEAVSQGFSFASSSSCGSTEDGESEKGLLFKDYHVNDFPPYKKARILRLVGRCRRDYPEWEPTLDYAVDTFERYFGCEAFTAYLEQDISCEALLREFHFSGDFRDIIESMPGVRLKRSMAQSCKDMIKQLAVNAEILCEEAREYIETSSSLATWSSVILSLLAVAVAYKVYTSCQSKKSETAIHSDDAVDQSINFSDRLAKVSSPKTKIQTISSERVVVKSQSMGMSDRMAVKNRPKVNVVAQMGSNLDPNGYNKCLHDFNRSSYILSVLNSEGEVMMRMGNMWFIRGSQALLPFHFVRNLLAECEANSHIKSLPLRVSKSTNARSFEFVLSVEEFLLSFVPFEELNEKNDIALVDFGRRCAKHRDIVESFCVEKDLEFTLRLIPIVMMFGDDIPIIVPAHASSVLVDLPVFDSEYGGTEQYKVHKCFEYRLPTVNGDCGALLAVMDPSRAKRKYFGMHVAGKEFNGLGFSVVVTQEMLRDYLEVMPDTIVDIDSLEFTLDEKCHAEPQFKVLGRLSEGPSHPQTTKIMPSLLNGNFEPIITAPSMMMPFIKDGIFIDPYVKAMGVYCPPKVLVPSWQVLAVENNMFCFLKDNLHFPVIHRLLSWEECLYGIENEVDSRGIPSHTSAGYPMVVPGHRNLKKELYRFVRGSPENKAVLDEIVEQCEEYEREASLGHRHLWLEVDNLKDERKSLESVQVGKTRVFSGTPFIYLILVKKYFGTFLLEFQKNRIFNSSVVGMNPYSGEWDLLARRLSRFSSSFRDFDVGAGDYSAFDGSELPSIHDSILSIVNRFYDDGNDLIREVLWLELTNSRHVYKNVVTEWCSGLPSGHGCTIMVNCLYNMFAFRLSWMNAGLDLNQFSDLCELQVCGDDNIFSVHPSVSSIFNEMSLSGLMAKIGLKYTTEIKETALYPFRDISEVEFLKRSFRWDGDVSRFIAPLRLSVVLEIPNWTKKTKDRDSISVSNINECSRELSLHSRSIFQRYNSKLTQLKERFYPEFDTSLSLYMSYLLKKKLVLATEQYFC